jgi:hypothetical protein
LDTRKKLSDIRERPDVRLLVGEDDAPKYGVEVAQSLLVRPKPLVSGAYLMPPASMPHPAGDVIEPIV